MENVIFIIKKVQSQFMFSQQRQKVISDLLLSPRCRPQKAAKPNGKFYSWKNHLNSQISNLYNRIQICQKQTTPQLQHTNIHMHNYEQQQSQLGNRKMKHNQNLGQNTNYFSRVSIGTNTPMKNYGNYQISKSATRQHTIFTEQKSSLPFIQIDTHRERRYKKMSQQVGQLHAFQSNETSQIVLSQKIGIEQSRNKLSNKRIQKNQNQQSNKYFDQYHLKLKQAERLYLLEKFMEHYQKEHKFKM